MEQAARAKGRNWMGTLNNPDIPAENHLRAVSQAKGVVYVVGQLESGSEGTEHVQYYVNLDKPQAMSFMKKICARSHWELARSDAASRRYVMKEDTRVEGPWEFGKRPLSDNNKADVEEKRAKKAEDNLQILQMGAEQAVDTGRVGIKDYKHLKQSCDLYRLHTQP